MEPPGATFKTRREAEAREMIMKHAETFDRGVGLILGRLLEEHPIEQRVFDLTKLDPEADAETLEIYEETMKFLIREGLIHGREISSNAPWFGNVSLTLATMGMMRATPDSLKERRTWGERIGAAARTGAKETLAIVTREFLQYAGDRLGLPRTPAAP